MQVISITVWTKNHKSQNQNSLIRVPLNFYFFSLYTFKISYFNKLLFRLNRTWQNDYIVSNALANWHEDTLLNRDTFSNQKSSASPEIVRITTGINPSSAYFSKKMFLVSISLPTNVQTVLQKTPRCFTSWTRCLNILRTAVVIRNKIPVKPNSEF